MYKRQPVYATTAAAEFRHETVRRFSGSVNNFVEKTRVSDSTRYLQHRGQPDYRESWQFDLLSLGITAVQFKLLWNQPFHSENLHVHTAFLFKLRDVLAFLVIQILRHIIIDADSDA